MRVRSIDSSRDWLFGKGQNDYQQNQNAVTQDIDTRLKMFLGDCFFSLQGWIDWITLLRGKSDLAISLAVSAMIANTDGVTAILQLSIVADVQRRLTITYQVQTIYSTIPINSTTVIIPVPTPM